VEPADQPGPHPAEIVIALGQQPHDLGVIGRFDPAQTLRAQGGDRHRQGVVGIVLIRTTRAEQADSRGQRRRDVDDVLSSVDELLGQQVAETAG
jgi:hypothetical protein